MKLARLGESGVSIERLGVERIGVERIGVECAGNKRMVRWRIVRWKDGGNLRSTRSGSDTEPPAELQHALPHTRNAHAERARISIPWLRGAWIHPLAVVPHAHRGVAQMDG